MELILYSVLNYRERLKVFFLIFFLRSHQRLSEDALAVQTYKTYQNSRLKTNLLHWFLLQALARQLSLIRALQF